MFNVARSLINLQDSDHVSVKAVGRRLESRSGSFLVQIMRPMGPGRIGNLWETGLKLVLRYLCTYSINSQIKKNPWYIFSIVIILLLYYILYCTKNIGKFARALEVTRGGLLFICFYINDFVSHWKIKRHFLHIPTTDQWITLLEFLVPTISWAVVHYFPQHDSHARFPSSPINKRNF